MPITWMASRAALPPLGRHFVQMAEDLPGRLDHQCFQGRRSPSGHAAHLSALPPIGALPVDPPSLAGSRRSFAHPHLRQRAPRPGRGLRHRSQSRPTPFSKQIAALPPRSSLPSLATRFAQMSSGARSTLSELIRNRMTLPYTRIPRRFVTEPHREYVLLDSIVAKPLSASIGQDDKIEARTYGHHILCVYKVRRVSSVNWTTQQNKLFHFQSELTRDHRNAAAVAVCEHVTQTRDPNASRQPNAGTRQRRTLELCRCIFQTSRTALTPRTDFWTRSISDICGTRVPASTNWSRLRM